LLDEQGKVVWAARYKAWGRILRYDAKEVEQPIRFQGQYEDLETGLYYNRHRYYDPDSARFITQDPIKLYGGYNLYRYGPNATGWVDPLGLTGVYIFETLNGNAYIGKGPYYRYQTSTLERTKFDGSFRSGGNDINKAVSRGSHSDVKSPCSNVSNNDYALMVESVAMKMYPRLPGAMPTLNRISSPGEKKLSSAKQGTKCPGLQVSADKDAAILIGNMQIKALGSGR
jgi:RHS repeat-associated protein